MPTKTFSRKASLQVFLSCLFIILLINNTYSLTVRWPNVSAGLNVKSNLNLPPQPPHLSGAYIQYWEDFLDETAWRNVLDSMVRAGIHHTIIIQHLESKTADGKEHKYYPANPNDFDPTRFILDYADSRTDMRVYIGLREDAGFLPTSSWDDTNQYALQLNAANGEADKNKALATEAWKRYGHGKNGKLRPSFAGWYLPNEMWNQDYSAVQITELLKFHRSISDFCKALDNNNKPVAVCPYFNPTLSELRHPLDAVKFAKSFGEFLQPTAPGQKGAGIDIVMLQDGAGERQLTVDNLKDKVEPFFKSFSEMCNSKKVMFWANVESWEYHPRPTYFPTDINRLEKQIEVTNPFVEQVVTFDYFHYMNPYGHFHPGEWKEAEKNLYWCYLRKFFPKAVKDTDPQCINPEESIDRQKAKIK
jgi:hypothetical protein